jgi:hypothetical protein
MHCNMIGDTLTLGEPRLLGGCGCFFERVIVSERSPVYKKSSVGQRGRQPRR